MSEAERLRIAVQKSGRLSEKSYELLDRAGLRFERRKDSLFSSCLNFPVDLVLIRDDDIPEYVYDGVCDLGIVGLNVLEEKLLQRNNGTKHEVQVIQKLGFGHCRLSLAIPASWASETSHGDDDLMDFSKKRIATSYPAILKDYLDKKGIDAKIIEITGSVEIAPKLKVADAICDLVSSGQTLRSNGLVEQSVILESEGVIAKTPYPLSETKQETMNRLLVRVRGVLKARANKYIMMNAPRTALAAIKNLLPGLEEPSIMRLDGDGSRIAIHTATAENVFWETMEKLKAAGASSILVLPIEKMIE